MDQNSIARIELRERFLKYFCFIVLLAVSIAHVLCRTGLFADGSAFLVAILQNQAFLVSDPTRNYATIITQIPVLSLLNLGLIDIKLLTYVQSFGLVFIPTAFWLSSLIVLLNDVFFWPFILFVSVVYLNTSFFVIGESHVAYSISACCIAVLLSHKNITIVRAVSLLMMSFIVMKTYEAMLFLGPLLSLMTVFRLYGARSRPTIVIILVGAVLLFIASSVIAASSILTPVHPASLSAALSSEVLYRDRQLILSLVLSVIYFIYVFHWMSKQVNRACTIAAAIALLLLIWPANWALPQQYYDCRVIVALWLFVFGLIGFIIRLGPKNLETTFFSLRNVPTFSHSRHGLKNLNSEMAGHNGMLICLPLCLLTVLAVIDIYHSVHFRKFIDNFASEVNSRTGIVALERTNILERGGLYYGWNWTYPCVSLLLRADESRAIILNAKEYDGWQPFNPQTSLPDLRRYYR